MIVSKANVNEKSKQSNLDYLLYPVENKLHN